MVKILVVVLALALRPSGAAACGNAIHLTRAEFVQRIVQIEKGIEVGRYLEARRLLYNVPWPTTALRRRAEAARAVIQLRVPDGEKDREAALRYFEARAGETDVRIRAWLAEAYVAAGRVDEARAILSDLVARDVMPDAVASLALAKVSTGAARAQAFDTCLARARNKRMCELPSTRR